MQIKAIQPYLVAAVAVALMPAISHAQTLEEVVVTAQKRQQTLSDVPISIAAISGEDLAAANLNSIDDIQGRVPNLRMTTAAVSTQIYIRGVGSGSNDGFEQSVGFYVDGIYGGRGRQFRSPFLDLERVEVLRGPQGVLLGKNTIGGAVNITTARPTDTFEGSITGAFGSEIGEKRFTGILSGPIGERMRGRIAATWAETDGYLQNTSTGLEEPVTEDLVLRGTLEMDLGDNGSARLKYERGTFDVLGSNYIISSTGPFAEIFERFDPNFSRRDNFSSKDAIETDFTESNNAVFTLDYDIGDVTLTSVTGYSDFTFRRRVDTDFSAIPLLTTDTMPERFDQLSQEFRITSAPGGRIEYIAGAYWQTNDLDTLRETSIDGATLEILLRDALNDPGAAALAGLTTSKTFQKFDQTSDTLAAFGQVTWNISDTLRATAGARWSSEDKEAVQSIIINRADGSGPLQDEVALLLVEGLFGFTNHRFDQDRSESDVSPTLNLQWDVSDDVMLYAGAAKGFKAGGFNAQERSRESERFEFEEESAVNLEMGAKMTLADGSAQLNIAAFSTTTEDLQVSTFTGVTFIVGNAAKSTATGIELDGRWRLSDNVEVGGALAILNSEFDSFPDAACFAGADPTNAADLCTLSFDEMGIASEVQDLTGQPTLYAPDHSGYAYVDVDFPMADHLLSMSLNWDFVDSFFYAGDLDPLDVQAGYGTFDARFTFGPTDGQWELSLIGQNLTEEATNGGYGADIPLLTGAHFSSTIRPRRVTLTGTYRFGDF